MKIKKHVLIKSIILVMVFLVALLIIFQLSKKNYFINGLRNKELESHKVDNWKYQKYEDSKTEYATCISSNSLTIDNSITKFELVAFISKTEKKQCYFRIIELNSFTAGFISNKRDSQYVTLQFDNEKEFNVDFVCAPDVPGDDIYLRSFDKIFDQLKKSKKLKVKGEFREVGWKSIEFNVENFKP